jgi:Mg-chelatase subunit ChlD
VPADSPVTRPRDGGINQRRTLTPLRRKPKTLTEEPALLDVSRPARPGGRVTGGGETRDRSAKAPTAAPGSGTAAGDEQADLLLRPEGVAAGPDAETLRRAREIATRLALRRPRREAAARRGPAGTLASVPYRGGADDIDLDQTLERLAGRAVAEDDDIVVRDRVATRRSVVLLVDVSGSMRGERVRTAAATVGALAAELSRDHLAVVAFWSDAAVLSHLGAPVAADRLVESMVRIPARGLTNVAFPLQVAAGELARVPARDARAVLLSDCVHNAGPDPRPFAARLPRLDVLLDTSGEQDRWLGGELARLGRGKLRVAGTYRDVAPALSSFFAD